MNPIDGERFLAPNEPPATRYDPQVVVKFRDDVQLPFIDNIDEFLARDALWLKLIEHFPNIRMNRLFKSMKPEQINEMVDYARANDPDYNPPNFLNYFIINALGSSDLAALARAISSWQSVANAYVVPKPAPPPNANPILDFQSFLNPAKEGINAQYAWPVPGGNGENIRLIDMEKGWYLGHPGLPAGLNPVAVPGSATGGGDNKEYRGHGTAVLGIILAQDPGMNCLCTGDVPCKCTGIAKRAITNWVSEYRSNTDNNPNKADAILATLAYLNSLPDSMGSVLLLESQSNLDNGIPAAPDFIPNNGYAPVEAYQAEFDAIKLATAMGMVVIEAAGNALETRPGQFLNGIDLDNLQIRKVDQNNRQITWKRSLNRTSPDYQDSGAIMVGAGTWAVEHERKPYPPLATSTIRSFTGTISATAGPPTNYGSRMDCYAWGEYVKTTGSGVNNSNNDYTTIFGGTSSAAAIIAGVALQVQGIAKANRLGNNANWTYSPSELRSILSNPAYGTASKNPANDKIGVMPDLKKILDNRMGLPPH